jgi:hypothetical protein
MAEPTKHAIALIEVERRSLPEWVEAELLFRADLVLRVVVRGHQQRRGILVQEICGIRDVESESRERGQQLVPAHEPLQDALIEGLIAPGAHALPVTEIVVAGTRVLVVKA